MNLIERINQIRQSAKQRPKRDREYAEEIINISSREKRSEALNKVPEDIRHVVKFYVMDYFAKRHKKPLPDLKK